MSPEDISRASFVRVMDTKKYQMKPENLKRQIHYEKQSSDGFIDSSGYSDCIKCGKVKTNNTSGKCLECRKEKCLVPWCGRTIARTAKSKYALCAKHPHSNFKKCFLNNKWVGPPTKEKWDEIKHLQYWDV